jgi:DNA-binding NarL/FixJ family response regulator
MIGGSSAIEPRQDGGITVAIVDDHPLVREGLAARIMAQPDMEVCGEAYDELPIFQLIGRGKSTREIAHELNVRVHTIDSHRGHIRSKLDLRNGCALSRPSLACCCLR